MLLRAIVFWLVIAAAETVHGIVRVRFLNRRVGDPRARQIGVLSGSVIIFALVCPAISWIGVCSVRDCLAIGVLWSTLMLAFDFGLGRLYFGFPWKRLLSGEHVASPRLIGSTRCATLPRSARAWPSG